MHPHPAADFPGSCLKQRQTLSAFQTAFVGNALQGFRVLHEQLTIAAGDAFPITPPESEQLQFGRHDS